jgi:preprotein translocase subunit YajC
VAFRGCDIRQQGNQLAMFSALLVLAEETTQKPPGATWEPLLLMGAVMLALYLIVLRPGQRMRERERQQLLTGLKKNDKVLTTAGIYGTVVSVSDKEDEVVVKVDDNTRLRMLKASIMRNLSNEEAQKAEKEQADKK